MRLFKPWADVTMFPPKDAHTKSGLEEELGRVVT